MIKKSKDGMISWRGHLLLKSIDSTDKIYFSESKDKP